MLVHSVFFWLKDELSEEQTEAFREGLDSLAGIPTVEALYVGTPASTPPRPVVDASYTFGITVLLQGMPAHDAYQEDPLHQAFLEHFADYWHKVLIYDIA